MQIRFYPKTSIRLVDTMVNQFFYQKPDIEYYSVRSFCPWRFDPIIEEEAGFDKQIVNMITKNQGFPGFEAKVLSNSKDDMINNDAKHCFY